MTTIPQHKSCRADCSANSEQVSTSEIVLHGYFKCSKYYVIDHDCTNRIGNSEQDRNASGPGILLLRICSACTALAITSIEVYRIGDHKHWRVPHWRSQAWKCTALAITSKPCPSSAPARIAAPSSHFSETKAQCYPACTALAITSKSCYRWATHWLALSRPTTWLEVHGPSISVRGSLD